MATETVLDLGQAGQAPSHTYLSGRQDQELTSRKFHPILVYMERNGDLIRMIHLVSTNEAAEMLGVTRQRIHQMIDEGKLDWYRYGKRKMLHRQEIERYMTKKQRQAS